LASTGLSYISQGPLRRLFGNSPGVTILRLIHPCLSTSPPLSPSPPSSPPTTHDSTWGSSRQGQQGGCPPSLRRRPRITPSSLVVTPSLTPKIVWNPWGFLLERVKIVLQA